MLECLVETAAETDVFQGACLDSRAERTVMGWQQAAAYARFSGMELLLDESGSVVFRFGGTEYPSQGKLHVRVPLANDLHLPLDVDVVDLNIPFLFGLDTMDANKMYLDNVSNKLVCASYQVSVPVVCKHGHAYREWAKDTLYTMAEVNRLHRHFCHPHPDRFFAVFRQANDPQATKDPRNQLEEVTATCDTCQRLAKEPSRFRASLPSDDLVFNRTVLIDIMFVDSLPVLHVVDKDTFCSAACFSGDGETSEAVWNSDLRTWVYVYAGHPDAMHTDQGTQFQSAA